MANPEHFDWLKEAIVVLPGKSRGGISSLMYWNETLEKSKHLNLKSFDRLPALNYPTFIVRLLAINCVKMLKASLDEVVHYSIENNLQGIDSEECGY